MYGFEIGSVASCVKVEILEMKSVVLRKNVGSRDRVWGLRMRYGELRQRGES